MAKKRTHWLLALMAISAVSGARASSDASTAREVLALAGTRIGLCLHLGSGSMASAALTAELAAQSEMVVHGLAVDAIALARARLAVEAQGLAGRAMVEKLALHPLPYLNDLADLVVIDDPSLLARETGLADEIMRVLAPGGAFCVRRGNAWARTIKPRPTNMDEWTHPNHGPDGNMVSLDRIVRLPLGYRWINGLPMNLNRWASCRAWVIAGGRLFQLTANVPENLGTSPQKIHYLTAHNAWNGLPQWKVNCETTDDGAYLSSVNFAPLATDGKRVYAAKQSNVVGFDAITGKEDLLFATPNPARRMILMDGVLVVSTWKAREPSRSPSDATSHWATWVAAGDEGTVEAYDAQTGAKKWRLPFPAQQVIGADGMVYLLTQKGNPPSERSVVAVDLQTGRERWRVLHNCFGEAADLQLNIAGRGYVVIAKRGDAQGMGAPARGVNEPPRLRAVYVLNAGDGKTRWQIAPATSIWTPVVDGLLWCQGTKYDLLTGQERGAIGWPIGDQVCTPHTIVNNYVVQSRGGQYIQLPENGEPARLLRYDGVRGACIEGMVPANGMFYTAQNNCQCMPGQVYGFLALGPSGAWPTVADFEKPRPVEKGPAFPDHSPPGNTEAGAWSTYRRDSERSAFTPSPLPDKQQELWRTSVARPPQGPLAAAWKDRLGACLSAPVIANGLVFVAMTDAGQIVALDATNGKPVWKTSLGGRVDTPPTIHQGLCLVGSHDGYVSALRAKDGALAWRFRISPWERRMVAYGEVESVWPAVGTVLVHDGVAYANAGRTSESDGGIAVVAFNPMTGAPVWARAIATGPRRMNDLLAVRDGQIAWHNERLDAKTGQPKPTATYPAVPSQGGMLDGIWTEFNFHRSGQAFSSRRVSANILAWSEKLVVSPKTATSAEQGAVLWTSPLPATQQVDAIVLASNMAVLAGRTSGPDGQRTGFLAMVSAVDGRILDEISLAALPVFDGMAIAYERLVVVLQDGSLVCYGKKDH